MKLETIDKVKRIIELGEDKKAEDPLAINIRTFSSLADYIVLFSAKSEPQMKAIFDNIIEGLLKVSLKPLCVEGGKHSDWLVMDFGDVVIHVFSKGAREFYDLEGLWSDAEVLDLSQAGSF